MEFDWNDLKYLIAVADHGSTIRAGSAIRVSQTTVARRLEALERAVGLKLVDRTATGYGLTVDGTALLEQARTVERAANGFGQAAGSRLRDIAGSVRITTDEIFAVGMLGPMLKEIASAHPEIRIELDTSEEYRDLATGDADLAIRSSMKDIATTGTDLVGRRVGPEEWAIFCSKAYAAERGAPRTIEELKQHPMVGGGGANVWKAYSAWLNYCGLEEQVAMQYGSASGLLSAVRSGLGVSMLPMLVGMADPELLLCFRPVKGNPRALWLLSHNRVRHNAAVRRVSDLLYDQLKQHAVRAEASAGE